jgi:phage shock protein PspC (stress-responsive transcriptional regulator)
MTPAGVADGSWTSPIDGHTHYRRTKRYLMDNIRDQFAHQGLMRPREGRVLGGVIAGLGRRFGIDPWPARLLFVLILMVIPGSQILIYPILWILMPDEARLTAGPGTPSTPSTPAGPPAPAM